MKDKIYIMRKKIILICLSFILGLVVIRQSSHALRKTTSFIHINNLGEQGTQTKADSEKYPDNDFSKLYKLERYINTGNYPGQRGAKNDIGYNNKFNTEYFVFQKSSFIFTYKKAYDNIKVFKDYSDCQFGVAPIGFDCTPYKDSGSGSDVAYLMLIEILPDQKTVDEFNSKYGDMAHTREFEPSRKFTGNNDAYVYNNESTYSIKNGKRMDKLYTGFGSLFRMLTELTRSVESNALSNEDKFGYFTINISLVSETKYPGGKGG